MINRENIRQIVQFEKVIEKFANKIGLDKKTLLNILNPHPTVDKDSKTDFESIPLGGHGRPQTSQDHRKQMDTGQAAMLAYTNLANDQSEEVPTSDWRRSANTRN